MNTFSPVTYPTETFNHAATGKAARKIRTSLGLSLRKAAGMMGVSAVFLSQLERGRTNWNPGIVKKFRKLKKA